MEGNKAPKKSHTIPGGFDLQSILVADIIVVATLFADIAQRDVISMETAIMTALWGLASHAGQSRWCLRSLFSRAPIPQNVRGLLASCAASSHSLAIL